MQIIKLKNKNMEQEKVFIYCRVSTVGQAEEGWSLDAQEKSCKKFAEDKGYKILKIFRDEGRSGTNADKRPALQEMISECQRTKNINAVIVYDTSRFARNTQDHLAVKAILKKVGTRLISLSQPMLDESATGKMVDVILASVNQFQSDMNSQKTIDGMQERFDSGWYPGLAKLGYLNEEVNEDKIIVNDPARWSLMKDAFKMYLKGRYSAIEISEIFYEKGLTSRYGKKISNSIMINILKNPFYAGLMQWGGCEKIGNHEAMITLKEHKRILQIMATHNNHSCRRRIHSFLLSGFTYCGICGKKRLVGEKHRAGRTDDYYHCSAIASRRKHTNEGQNIEIGELEKMVEEKFKGIQFSKEFINAVIEKVREFWENKMKAVNIDKRGLLNKRTGIEKKKVTAEEKLIAGTLKDNDFTRMRDRYDAEIKGINMQLEKVEEKKNIDIDTVRATLNLTRNIYGSYKKSDFKTKRLYLSIFWDGFWVKDKKIIEARLTPLMDALVEKEQMVIKNPTISEDSNKNFVRLLNSASEHNSMSSDTPNGDVRITSNWLRR